jgi:endonuclease YncB( thermonuclease family)
MTEMIGQMSFCLRLWFACAAVCGALVFSASADPIQPHQVAVIDGDTIRIDQTKPDIRLVGFNAPETSGAKCPAERELGATADRRLRELVQKGDLDFALVDCSCPPGTAGTPSCNYGRKCGTLKAEGRDVGDILIAEKLAVPFTCGKTRCPKTPRPWC